MFVFSSCLMDEPADPLKADDTGGTNGVNFYASATEVETGETISFYNSSSNEYYQFYWEFGDGRESAEENPSIVYNEPGVYDISLTAYSDTEIDVEIKYGYITVIDNGGGGGSLEALFSANTTSIIPGETVTFTSASTGYVDSYYWDFGDGETLVGYYPNPSHTYYEEGTYTVSLTVYDPGGDSDTETKYNYIVVSSDGGNVSYCTSYGSNSSYEWIDYVAIGSAPPMPTGNDGGYGDYTNAEMTIQTGQNLYINIAPGYSDAAFYEYFRVWIDFNKDGDFSDSGELIASGNADGAVEGTIFIPSYSGTTRMRVSMKRNSYADPCDIFSYGEVEDYTVILNSEKQTNNISDVGNKELKPVR